MALTLCVVRRKQPVALNAKPKTVNAGHTLASIETDAVPSGFIRTTFLERYKKAIKKVRNESFLVRDYDRAYGDSMLNKVIDVVEELEKKEGKIGAEYTKRKLKNPQLTEEDDFKRFTLEDARKVANYPIRSKEHWDLPN